MNIWFQILHDTSVTFILTINIIIFILTVNNLTLFLSIYLFIYLIVSSGIGSIVK